MAASGMTAKNKFFLMIQDGANIKNIEHVILQDRRFLHVRSDVNEDTPLIFAIRNRRNDVAGLILGLGGVDINDENALGETALFVAAATGQVNIARFLLTAGAETELDDEDGLTPLHAAINGGHAVVVALLLEHGANRKAKTAAGLTPRKIAAARRDTNILELLKNKK